jgi:hypothetical protein
VPDTILEKQLSEIWRSQRIRPAGLVTGDGQNVTVLYPGRLNDGRGGDFRDAVVMVDGKKVSGDIELHVRSGDWVGHGHHKDAAYNRVVLHVVWCNTGGTTLLQNGIAVPVLALQEYVPAEAYQQTGHTDSSWPVLSRLCAGVAARPGEASLARLVDEAGDTRFNTNAEKFQQQMAAAGPEQVLYAGIMTALGYSKNKAPFRELSCRLPLNLIESIISGDRPENMYHRLYTLMLQVAGLAPVKQEDSRAENIPEPPEVIGNIESMSAGDWDFYKVRPGNSPVARIGAATRLLLRYRDTGLLEGLIGLVRHAPSVRVEDYLQAGLLVDGIGRPRVDDIIVNVLLPFTLAFGPANSGPSLGDLAFRLYQDYKRLTSNCLERHMMVQLGLPRRLVNTARRQQGLLHIYKTMCIQAKCTVCILAQPQPGDDIDIQAVGLAGLEAEVTARRDHRRVIGAEDRRRNQHRQG